MLSRVAERMYWLGRYVERSENTARLVGVNANLLLDLPRAVKLMWRTLTDIIDSSDVFLEHYTVANERNVIKFMLADEFNPSSLLRSVRAARENVRTAREVLPGEAWELINEFYLYTTDHMDGALSRSGRHGFLDAIVDFCHRLNGLLFGTMSHNEAWGFIRLGQNLERADMTSRILDVGSRNVVQGDENIPVGYDGILWMNVLQSLSANQVYRKQVHERVNGPDVLSFLLSDRQFPRAVAHCLAELVNCLGMFPRNEGPLRAVTRVQRIISEVDAKQLMDTGVRAFIDDLQVDFAAIHDEIERSWFRPDASGAVQIQMAAQLQVQGAANGAG